MNTESFWDPIRLAQQFEDYTKLSSWEKGGVTLDGLQKLIDNNQRLFSQTFEESTARKLSDAMSKLSARVSKEYEGNKEGVRLASNIQFYAKGVFNEGSTTTKVGLDDVPAEVLEKEILSKVLPMETPIEEFRDSDTIKGMTTVARKFVQPTQGTFAKWIEEQGIPLIEVCKTDVVDFIIKNKMTKVNLSHCIFSPEDLKRLAKYCPNITHLELDSPNLIDFPYQNLTKLKSLTLHSVQSFGAEITDALGDLSQLKQLKFIDCNLKEVHFAAAISQSSSLEGLAMEHCPTSEAWMAVALLNPKLKSLNFKKMGDIGGEEVTQILSKKTNLESLTIDDPEWISNDWLELVCKDLTQLRHLAFHAPKSYLEDRFELYSNICSNKPLLDSFQCDYYQLSDGRLTFAKNAPEDVVVSVLERFSNIKSLTISDLNSENMGDRIADTISKLSHLESLTISPGYDKIPTDWLAKAFAGLTKLQKVDLNIKLDGISSDTWLNLFRNNPQLASLTFLANHSFNDDEMKVQMQVINDRMIFNDLYGIPEDLIITLIEAIPKLKTLTFKKYTTLETNESAQAISKHTELETISFDSSYKLTPEWVSAAFGGLTGLRNISISSLSHETEEELAKIVHNNPQLESLSLPEYSGQGEGALSKAVGNHDKLAHLTLSKSREMTLVRLFQMLQHLPQLQSLDVSKSYELSEVWEWDPVDFEEVFSTLSELRSLNFKECRIPEVQLNFILYKLPHSLQDLDISSDFKLTGEKLIKGLAKHSQLQSLNLEWCGKVTFEALKNMLKVLPNLRSLNLLHCDQFSEKQIEDIKALYPNLEIEFIPKDVPSRDTSSTRYPDSDEDSF